GTSNIEANSSMTSSLTSPPNILSPNTSQLRQPSNLRNTLTGAASKIPRPGKKPYAKPVSRLPKPKALTKLGSTTTATTTTVTTTPPQSTRRARLNAAAAIAPKPRSTNTVSNELPPDIIILQPRPPKEAPRLATPEPMTNTDQEPIVIEGEDSIVSVRASPPIESGLSPPRSGLLLRDEARRLKQEAEAPSPTIPVFTATAPSLGIFPSTARPKGRGKNTLIRPMMMPLDPTSLRNLTTSNTLRNQQYLCSQMETQIIMKEGKRPASPTSKVRTLLDKQKEEKDKSRGERAARRRIASGDGDEEMEDSAAPRKHPRAAGDDEDYRTPAKIREQERMEVDEPNEKAKRRVKWNVDLLQRFEMDQSDLEGIKKSAEIARTKTIAKSCLTTRVLLDPLGNVPDADVPIADLKKIDVIVTKLVYADDLPPVEQPAPKPPPKQTGKRAATKKSKSPIAVDIA
ncbi:1752_t:CDS:2, partial [Acaulospora colombiana]